MGDGIREKDDEHNIFVGQFCGFVGRRQNHN
jgi:hypothetical protein